MNHLLQLNGRRTIIFNREYIVRKTVLIIGGCRSGKSSHALHLADKLAKQKIFIATCVPHDKEMEQRVLHHQKQRNPNWKTLEVPLLLPEAICENSLQGHVILVDCLTLWINNLLMENSDPENIDMHVQKLIQSLEKPSARSSWYPMKWEPESSRKTNWPDFSVTSPDLPTRK